MTPDERRILDARARAVAEPAQRFELPRTPRRLLVVSGERYAIDADRVRSVDALRRITPLPHTPAHVLGVVVWSGVAVPVFHLRALLGRALTALPEFGRVVFLGEGDDVIGLVVDAVGDAGALTLSPDPNALASARAPRSFARAVAADGTVVLDADALLRCPETTLSLAPPSLPRRDGAPEEPR